MIIDHAGFSTTSRGRAKHYATLRDVVRFYVTRDVNPGDWYPRDRTGAVMVFDDLPAQYHTNVNRDEVPYDRKPGQQPRLNDHEIDAIVAFLGTLTDEP